MAASVGGLAAAAVLVSNVNIGRHKTDNKAHGRTDAFWNVQERRMERANDEVNRHYEKENPMIPAVAALSS
jgi:hypothetical protein